MDEGREFSKLKLALRSAPGGSLVFVQLQAPEERRRLPQRLREGGVPGEFVYLNFGDLPEEERTRHPVRVLSDALRREGGRLLFVDGIEARPDFHLQHESGDCIEKLNLGRESLARLGARTDTALVFLLPDFVLELIESYAADLWSWRSYDYALDTDLLARAAPSTQRRSHGASRLTWSRAGWDSRVADRERRIRILRERLDSLAEQAAPLRLDATLALARALSEAGRAQEALTLLDSVAEAAPGQLHAPLALASWREERAEAHRGLGQLHEARDLLVQALLTRTAVLGEESPATVHSLLLLAGVDHQLGQRPQAIRLYKKAVALCAAVFGPAHQETARAQGALGRAYRDEGRLAEAEPLLLAALGVLQTLPAGGDLDLADVLYGLALLKHDQGKDAESAQLRAQALERYEAVLGPAHPQLVILQQDLLG